MSMNVAPGTRCLATLLTVLVWLAMAGIAISWIVMALALKLPVDYPDQIVFIAPEGYASESGSRPVSAIIFAAATVMMVGSDILLGAAIACLLPVARVWRRGRLFDQVTTGYLMRFAWLLVAMAVWEMLYTPLTHALLGLTGYGPQSVTVELLALSFWSPLIVATLILVIVRAMRVAAEMEKEAKLVI